MKLPVPIFHKGVAYRYCEIQKPKASVLADTKKVIDQTGDLFTGMRTFLHGSIVEFKTDDSTINDPIAIKSLIPKLPFISTDFLALKAVVMMNPDDDGIEGVYFCPRCQTQVISEVYSKDGIEYDTRDFISQLTTKYLEGDDGEFTIEFKEPVEIIDAVTKNIIVSASNVTLRFPTLENSISAFQKYGRSDKVRLQLAQYAECIVKVDGVEVDSKFRNAFGLKLFEEDRNMMQTTDQIAGWLNQYGIQNKVEKMCHACGKVWQPYVNTSNFFASGLR